MNGEGAEVPPPRPPLPAPPVPTPPPEALVPPAPLPACPPAPPLARPPVPIPPVRLPASPPVPPSLALVPPDPMTPPPPVVPPRPTVPPEDVAPLPPLPSRPPLPPPLPPDCCPPLPEEPSGCNDPDCFVSHAASAKDPSIVAESTAALTRCTSWRGVPILEPRWRTGDLIDWAVAAPPHFRFAAGANCWKVASPRSVASKDEPRPGHRRRVAHVEFRALRQSFGAQFAPRGPSQWIAAYR